MRLSELIESINGVPVYAAKRRSGEKKAAETEITGISDDSRYIGRGEAFFALGGGSADGRDFAAEAARKGAAAIVAETPVDLSGTENPPPQILVKDAREAISLAACAFYGNPAKKCAWRG